MNILFLTHPYPNYVPDLLLHGLRKLVGAEVVDYPRKDCLYEGNLGLGVCPDDQRCPGWFPNDDGAVDRTDIWQKTRNGYFDLIAGDVRSWSSLSPNLSGFSGPLAIIDGEDRPCPIPVGPYAIFRRETDGTDFSIPLPMALPEEVFNWIARYDDQPKRFTIGFLGSTQDDGRKKLIDRLHDWYPDSLFETSAVPSNQDPEPRGRIGRDAYYRALQQCRFVLNLPGAGLDTFRFWENSACNSVHITQQLPLLIPSDFIDKEHLIRFDTVMALKKRVDGLLDRSHRRRSMAAMNRHHLINHHLTTHRAKYFIEMVQRTFQMKSRIKHINGEAGGVAEAVVGDDNNGDPDLRSTAVHNTVAGTVYLGLVRGDNFGWGVCSRYLKKELSRRVSVQDLNSNRGPSTRGKINGRVLQALTGPEFSPMFEDIRGAQNFAYTFFETELGRQAVTNAGTYDLVMGGSTWCHERMQEHGIKNSAVLLQGVDPKLFYPIKAGKSHDRFIIFSGGKFELRKGQDLVLRAIKTMQEKYSDVWLVNCWRNFWPASARMMESSRHIDFKYEESASWQQMMSDTYARNGLSPERIVTLDLVPHHRQRQLFSQTDIALFPNRCEGGTNLVMMEYMACAKPVIASYAHGHKDILTSHNALCLNEMKTINIADHNGDIIARWQEPTLEEIVAKLEFAYHQRDQIRAIGMQAGEHMKRFTWRHAAQRLLELIEFN
jgi:glycosyltransferase involved in cell wall biosynthesis